MTITNVENDNKEIKSTSYETTIVCGNLSLCLGRREVLCDASVIDFTGLEFHFLQLLMFASPQIMTRDNIAQQLFRKPLSECDKCINIHILNIRKKLQKANAAVLVKSIRGQGYFLQLT